MPPVIATPSSATIISHAIGWKRKLPSVVSSGPCLPQVSATKWSSSTNTPIAMTDAGAKRAETSLFSRRLMATEPIAMPIEKMAMNRLATCSSAPSTFFTSGGKMMISTAPIVQKKLIDEDREEQAADVHRRADQLDRGVDDVPVDRHALGRRRGRRNLPAGEEAEHGDAPRSPPPRLRCGREHAGEDRAAEDREIGAGFDQAGAAEHFVLLQMLRQDRVFDRPEEGRVDAHREHRGEHQRDAGEA